MSYGSIDCPPRIGDLVWVYLLETADHGFYIGQSRDVGERLREHRLGRGSKFTADHQQPRLVYVEGPLGLAAGIARERQLKGWSRAKKAALITGNFARLRALSQSREASKRPAAAGGTRCPNYPPSGTGYPTRHYDVGGAGRGFWYGANM